MGRVAFDEIDNYGGQGGAGFFRLKKDKEVAQVRFLYNDIEDVEAYAVHKVDTPDSKYGRYVNCLRSYDEPKDNCPFCREGVPQQVRLFIPLYNIDEDKIQIWDRGKTFAHKMTSLCSRYPNLVSHIFEIERNGKENDKKTTYEVYEVDQDDTTLEDFDELQDILGGAVLEKSVDDMEYYLEEKEFPPEEGDDEPVRRRTSSRGKKVEEDDELPFDEEEEEAPRRSRSERSERSSGRRTPAKSRRKDEDF